MKRIDFLLQQINKASYELKGEDKVSITVNDLLLLRQTIKDLQVKVEAKSTVIKELRHTLHQTVSSKIKLYKDLQEL